MTSPVEPGPAGIVCKKNSVTASEIVAIILNYLTREESVCTFFLPTSEGISHRKDCVAALDRAISWR